MLRLRWALGRAGEHDRLLWKIKGDDHAHNNRIHHRDEPPTPLGQGQVHRTETPSTATACLGYLGVEVDDALTIAEQVDI